MNEKALETWNAAWNTTTHTTEHAIKRIQSAKTAKLTPIRINAEDCFGYFSGKHGHYETWLDECNCGDFKRYNLPCKHIYRLAIELGVLNEKAEMDSNMIQQPMIEKVSLSKTIDIVEALSEVAQKCLKDIAANTTIDKPTIMVNANDAIEELLHSGILVKDGFEILEEIKFGLKKEIADFLSSHNIQYLKTAKKSELESICLSVIPEETKEHFGIIRHYKVLISGQYSRQNIHRYLHRKFDYTDFFDDNVAYVPLLKTWLPEDKVTDELIKRGYYCRDGIEKPNEDIFFTRIAVKLQ
jgi:hypothetical protein